MRRSRDLTNQRFGRLKAIRRTNEKGEARWLCECECGNVVEVIAHNLIRENTKSCGCYQKDRAAAVKRTHGERRTRLYTIWVDMRARCYRESEHCYPNYGGRGISVCENWKDSFENFREWAYANGYKENLTIDRKDNDGDYCPENCRWTTVKTQANNRRTNVYVTVNGETHTLAEWSDINKIAYGTIQMRRKRGWSDVDAVSIPVNSTR